VVTFDVTAVGASDHEAVAAAVSAIRAAIHAVGGATPGFASPHDFMDGATTFRAGHLEKEPA
jgi:hypothetical protein